MKASRGGVSSLERGEKKSFRHETVLGFPRSKGEKKEEGRPSDHEKKERKAEKRESVR